MKSILKYMYICFLRSVFYLFYNKFYFVIIIYSLITHLHLLWLPPNIPLFFFLNMYFFFMYLLFLQYCALPQCLVIYSPHLPSVVWPWCDQWPFLLNGGPPASIWTKTHSREDFFPLSSWVFFFQNGFSSLFDYTLSFLFFIHFNSFGYLPFHLSFLWRTFLFCMNVVWIKFSSLHFYIFYVIWELHFFSYVKICVVSHLKIHPRWVFCFVLFCFVLLRE